MKSAPVVHPLALLIALALSVLAPARAAPPTTPFPGWSELSVTTTTPGSATVDSKGVWTVQGSGNMPWIKRGTTNDAFEIVFKQLTGDGSVTTRLLGPAAVGDEAKIGLMMREDLSDPAAKMITLHRAGAGLGGESWLRAVTGEPFSKDRKMAAPSVNDDEMTSNHGGSNLFPPSQLPIWLKLERRGNGFTPYASTDGAFWIPVGRTQQIPMKATISAGVFVAADSDGTLQSATFDGTVTDVSARLLQPAEAAPLQPNPVIAFGGDNKVMLSWDPVNHLGQAADGYRVYKGPLGDDSNLTKIADLTASQTSYVDTTIKNGELARYRVTTLVNLGGKAVESQTITNQLYTFSGAPNPPVQIGNQVYLANVLDCGGDHELTDKAGSASVDAKGVVTLTFGGWDISMEADGGEVLLTPVSGDFTFTARVLGVPTHPDGSDADEWAKSGIIVRQTPLAESRYVGMFMTPGHGLRSAHRRHFNAGQTWDNGAPSDQTPDLPAYFRIQRRGQIISVFTSTDGKTFTPNGDVETVDMTDLPATVYVGFAGTAGGVQLPITQEKFDQVTLTTP
jgi:regulation of enolase protein 1 (concanavalin A-like superfamily)